MSSQSKNTAVSKLPCEGVLNVEDEYGFSVNCPILVAGGRLNTIDFLAAVAGSLHHLNSLHIRNRQCTLLSGAAVAGRCGDTGDIVELT